MLRLEQVGFRYEGSELQFDFSIEVSRGEVIGVMGESGSGKSTLLDLISGFQRANSGEISWDGQDIGELPPELRPVTILFQHHNLFEHLSAARNVSIGLNGGGSLSVPQTKSVTLALERVGLGELEQRSVASLSGGQQQRVALARAIVRQQPILLLDEPFSGLDDKTRFEMLALVRRLADEDERSVVMVTHDKSDCEAIASRTLRVTNGSLEVV